MVQFPPTPTSQALFLSFLSLVLKVTRGTFCKMDRVLVALCRMVPTEMKGLFLFPSESVLALVLYSIIITSQPGKKISSVFPLGEQDRTRTSERLSPPPVHPARHVALLLTVCFPQGEGGIRLREGGGTLQGCLFFSITSFSRMDILSLRTSFSVSQLSCAVFAKII